MRLLLLSLFLLMSCTKEITKIKTIEKPVYKTRIMYDTVTRVVDNHVECQPVKVIRKVFFEFDSYKLSPESKAILDNVTANKAVIINAHSCDIGTFEHNVQLRLLRGEAVRLYLNLDIDDCIVNTRDSECQNQNKKLCRNVEVVSYE